MEDLNVKNVQQYVANAVITELNKQNKELEKLRHLASKVEHCSVCYSPVDEDNYNKYRNYLLHCEDCDKIVCANTDCSKGWLLDMQMDEYESDYCCEECYNNEK